MPWVSEPLLKRPTEPRHAEWDCHIYREKARGGLRGFHVGQDSSPMDTTWGLLEGRVTSSDGLQPNCNGLPPNSDGLHLVASSY